MSTPRVSRTQFLVAFRRQDAAGPEWQSVVRRFDKYADAAGYRDEFNNRRDGAPPVLELTVVERVVEAAESGD